MFSTLRIALSPYRSDAALQALRGGPVYRPTVPHVEQENGRRCQRRAEHQPHRSKCGDVDQDGAADLTVHIRTSDALQAALTDLYADLLLVDFEDAESYDAKQEGLIALDGVFGDYGQEFQGSDSVRMFLAGQSLKALLASLGIS